MIPAASLWELVERRAQATPHAVLAVDERDQELTFGGYRDAALRCAAGLHEHYAVAEGTRVSWMLPTRLESLVLVAALARLGAVQNPILPIYREREVRFIARQAEPRLLLVPGQWRGFDYAGMANSVACADGLQVCVVDRALPEAEATAESLPTATKSAGDDDPVRWIFYSSGTTAEPKGALHTDGTLLATARGMSRVLDLQADDRIAMVFPFTHVGGIGWLFSALLVGCRQILVEAFDPSTSIDLLVRHGVTQATAGTAFHQAYLAAQRQRQPGGPSIFPSVRCFPGGGAPKPPQLHFDLKRELGGAGIVSGYGMTECPILAMNSIGDSDEKLAYTEGPPCPAEVEIAVVAVGADEDRRAAPGEEGEFRVKAPQLCKGYLDPVLNAAAFDAAGFFRTGDLGYLDRDGYVVVTGRLKDVIIRKGENISAKEIEDLLFAHPKVADAAVVGVPDAETGERCCAVVACRDSADPLGFDEMVTFLRERQLMLQKIPERLELVEALPRNVTGKVLKHELRSRFAPIPPDPQEAS